jgi:hypothetical protein
MYSQRVVVPKVVVSQQQTESLQNIRTKHTKKPTAHFSSLSLTAVQIKQLTRRNSRTHKKKGSKERGVVHRSVERCSTNTKNT